MQKEQQLIASDYLEAMNSRTSPSTDGLNRIFDQFVGAIKIDSKCVEYCDAADRHL